MTERRAERGEDGERRTESGEDGERRERRVARTESGGADGEPRSGEDGERRGRRVTLTGERHGRRKAQHERCAGGGMRGRRGGGGRGTHLAIRPIEQLVSSTVVMYRLQHIQVSQTGAVVKTDNAMT